MLDNPPKLLSPRFGPGNPSCFFQFLGFARFFFFFLSLACSSLSPCFVFSFCRALSPLGSFHAFSALRLLGISPTFVCFADKIPFQRRHLRSRFLTLPHLQFSSAPSPFHRCEAVKHPSSLVRNPFWVGPDFSFFFFFSALLAALPAPIPTRTPPAARSFFYPIPVPFFFELVLFPTSLCCSSGNSF